MTVPYVPTNGTLADVIRAVQQLTQGRSNAIGTVTLTPSTTTTTVTDANCASGSVPRLMPTTSNAAAAMATTYIATVSNGSFVITHANNAQVDRTFKYAIQG